MSEVVAREFVDRFPDLGYECEENEAIGSMGALHLFGECCLCSESAVYVQRVLSMFAECCLCSESAVYVRSTIEQQVYVELMIRLRHLQNVLDSTKYFGRRLRAVRRRMDSDKFKDGSFLASCLHRKHALPRTRGSMLSRPD